MITRLVVNGDSYMEVYAQGNGHGDLAERLNIPHSHSLAIGGSADSRLIRTCLKDSYQTKEPTLYVIGIGFLSRWEVPVLKNEYENSFEGRWTNPQNQDYKSRWEHNWNASLTKQLIDLKLITDYYSVPDRLEDLMYRLTAMIADLHSRGHRVVIFQQADSNYQRYLDRDVFFLFKNNPIFIDGLKWLAVPWQLAKGVKTCGYGHSVYHVPDELKHPDKGQHHFLNEFLAKYIKEYILPNE